MASSTSRTIQFNIVGKSTSLQGAMNDAAKSTQSATSKISSAWKGVASGLNAAFGSTLGPIVDTLEQFSGSFDGISKGGITASKALGAIGLGSLAAGSALSTLGSADKQADNQLAQSFTNAGSSMDDYQGKIDDTVKQMAKYGYSASTVKSSLSTLVTSTKNPTTAIGLMGTAANLAATKHESLSTAVSQLNQVIAGKGTRTLSQLGITSTSVAVSASTLTSATKAQQTAQEKLATAQENLNDLEAQDHGKKTLTIADQQKLQKAQEAVTKAQAAYSGAVDHTKQVQQQLNNPLSASKQNLDAIAKVTSGQASAAADTYKGKLLALKTEVENQVSELGQKYGPALQGVGSAMAIAGAAGSSLKGAVSAMSKVLGDAGGTAGNAAKDLGTAEKATKDLSTAEGDGQKAASLLAGASGIGLIVLAVAGLVIGIYELVTHWSTVMNALKTAASAAWTFIKNNFINPIESGFSSVVGFVRSVWSGVTNDIISPIDNAYNRVAQIFWSLVSIVQGVGSNIWNAARGMWSGISADFENTIGEVISIWDDVAGLTSFTVPSFNTHIPGVGKIGGFHIGPLLPEIRMFAEGGIATGPTLGVFGEAGTEAIVPLDKADQMGFGGGALSLQVPLVIDGRQFAMATAQYTRAELLRTAKRNGSQVGLT